MGGIGDQIFQYSYACYLKRKFKCSTYLDISYFGNKKNFNKFKFELTNLANRNFLNIEKNISYLNFYYVSYLRFIELLIFKSLKILAYRLFFKVQIENFFYQSWKTSKKILAKPNSYYFGIWHDLKFVKKERERINKYLINLNINKSKIKKFMKRINFKTVAVHIRGGDFKFLPSLNILDTEYYQKAFDFYTKKLNNPTFHIFTDDLILSKKILSKIKIKKNFIFIKKYKFTDIEEFSLFSKYSYAIIANSTFSLMSSYLSLNRKISLAPLIWLRGKKVDKKKRFKKLKFV